MKKSQTANVFVPKITLSKCACVCLHMCVSVFARVRRSVKHRVKMASALLKFQHLLPDSHGSSDIITDLIRPNGARGAISTAASSEGSPTKTFTDLCLKEHPFVGVLREYVLHFLWLTPRVFVFPFLPARLSRLFLLASWNLKDFFFLVYQPSLPLLFPSSHLSRPHTLLCLL